MSAKLSRRALLSQASTGFGMLALQGLLAAKEQLPKPHFPPKVKHVIFAYMSGGVSHIDSFDPKPRLDKEAGQPMPFPVERTMFNQNGNIMPSPWKFRNYGQSGIPVSARDAEFPIFDQVLADLGDNQSIAESLSSFSAHIRRVQEMLSIVTPDSLVLLDELGRATDPEEGGALGVAIVEHFRSWKAFTLASTHLLALKIYGASREGVRNGSMGFDRDTLQPGAKFYDWERKGVPVRVELGPKDLEKDQVCVKMRVDSAAGKGKEFLPTAQFVATIVERLTKFQDALLAAARQRMHERSVQLNTWDEFLRTFSGDQSTFAWCHWDGTRETEARIKELTRATIRCIPLPGQGPEPEPGSCIVTGKPSPRRVLIAKAY